ncbi:MAG: sacsin N-terminal ATP-binding-like domain-containing protein, partial [Myxococcota bacterium]
MAAFATLPFADQLARIRAVVAEGADPGALLREAADLPDAEPLALLLETLAAAGRLGPDRSGELAEVAGDMPDAALQYLFFREPMHPRVREVLAEVAERAVRTWSLERVHALVLLSRWLRQRAPEVHGRLVDAAEQHLNDAEPDGRWLLFASGERLASLAHDARWGPSVRRTVRRVLDALARAPKSISQANAEALLAKRVYADAGHFFFELLQNADDAGATRWAADIHADRIVARHDGTPFSFRDVVGLLSIGQTTKEQEQIGFFGVGFKSVYEVCDRPRVHSGPFDFEIAHVSIPRALSERPAEAGADAGDTALVLPLDPDVDVETLHARARAIPPETLLTLPHVAGMRVQGPDGTPWAWTKEPAGATVTLRRSGSDDARRYRCARRHVRFEGRREANRTDESPVLVAVALDDEGRPRPVDGATVFAFLPTSEHTGLRALVHARFDVTLDRERLERGSPWNDALLSEAGRGLADVVLQLVEDGADPLPVLPSPAEMAPGMAPLAHALREALADRACLPSADGARVAPRRARLLDPPLAHALAGLDLGGGSRALAPLDPRGQQVARFLGATPFTGADLVRFAGRALRAGTAPPPWLGEPVWRALGEAAVEDAALRALPLLVDGAGALVAAEEARVGAGPWAALYAGERPVVAEDELARLPAALRRRIAPAPFDPAQAVTDLQDPARRERLVAKEDALLRALAGLDDDDLAALAEVPLLRTGGGPRRSIAQGLRRLEGTLADLADVLASEVPLLAPDVERAHEALVARWVPRFGLSELADVLATGGLREAAGAERVHGVLDREAPRIGRPLALRFASVPLFSDRHGVRRPLRGPDRALRTRDDSLARALPDWPWLDAPDRPFLHAMDLPEVDAPAVVAALSGDPDMPPVPEGALPQVLPWLVAHAGALSARAVDDLAQAPVWLDAQGRPRALHALRPGGGSEAVVAFFEAAGTRTEAHAVSLRLASALRLAERLPASDLEAAVTDLARADLAPAVDRTVVAAVLAEAAETLPSERLAPLWARPLFEDGDGVRRSLTSWAQPDPQACHRAGPFRSVLRIGPLPLLSVQDEGLYRAFLGRAGPAEATAADLVRHAHADRTLLGHPAAFRQVLQAHGTELDAADRALVAELPVFRDATGTCRAARALCPRTPLLQFGDAFPLSGLGDALLDPEDEALARQLDLPTRSPAELLAERVLPTLVEGAPLAAQPEPFNGPRAVRALLEVAYAEGVDVLGHPLCVDLQGRLVRGPLASASEAVRKLAPRLGLAEMLADGPWADALSDAVASVVLERMSARRVTEALRACCPEEAPRQDHPVLADVDPLYGFLREAGPAIEADAPARGALGAAAVLPSQRGTLRAPRELVLDAAVPDLGLAWGLAPEVPP